MGKYLIVVFAIVVTCAFVSLAELECIPGELIKRLDLCLCYCGEDGKTEICPSNGCPNKTPPPVPSSEGCNSSEEICETEECLRSAATLRMNLDLTADPCEDFYQYTCGNWENNHPDADDKIFNNWATNIQKHLNQKLRMFLVRDNSEEEPVPVEEMRSLYSTCMDTDSMNDSGYHTVKMLMKDIGFPAVPQFFTSNFIEEWNKTTSEVLIERINSLYGMSLFLSSGEGTDRRNNSVTRILITGLDIYEGDNGLPQIHQTMTRRSIEEEQVNTEYGIYVSKVITEYLQKTTGFIPPAEELNSAVESIVNIDHKLQRITERAKKYNESDNLLDEIMDISVASLQNITDQWLKKRTNGNLTSFPFFKTYLEEVFKERPDSLLDLDNQIVQIMKKDVMYLKLIISEILAKETPEAVELYLWWSLLKDVVIHTTDEMRRLNQDYEGDISQPSRSSHCIRIVGRMMGMALTYAIADQDFLEQTKPKVETMLDLIKKAFYQLVDELDWMDEISKQEAREKAKQMKGLIGFPESILNGTVLEEYYDNIYINQSDYLGTLLTLRVQSTQRIPIDNWETNPTQVNAFYTAQSNTMAVHWAYLQFPFYQLGLESLNYGAAGSTIGHELTHGFDDSGRYYDKEGNMIRWWTNQTINEYVNRTKCFLQQYSSYEVPKIGTKVDGKHTLGENISDNGGLREAYMAYQMYQQRYGAEKRLPGFRNYTAEHLFFLSYANSFCGAENVASMRSLAEDTHSPDRIRVNIPLSYFPEFATAFHCREGDKMVAKNQCRIW